MVDSVTQPTVTGALRGTRSGLGLSHEQQFWLLQLLGWSGWGIGGALSWAYWDVDAMDLWLFVPAALLGLLYSSGLRYAYRAIWDVPVLPRVAMIIALSYLTAGLWQFSKNAVHAYLQGKAPGTDPGYFDGILLASFYPVLCWSGLYFGIKYYQMLQDETAKVLRVSSMAHQAQLKMLRYQLNPHFLFNTLNAISTLILEADNATANRMITRLSSFLRYSLDSDPMQTVTLEQEVAALKLYLDIEQVRFDDRLRLQVDVEDRAAKALIPSLILQPLVENAIKYAIAQSETGGTIRLGARVFARELLLELSDDGPGIPDPEQPSGSGGVGLANTRDRLRELHGAEHSFTLENLEPHGLKVCMRIPYQPARP